jgi:1-acyl-sn-glycerol-3-phosphate acyltransferase
MECMTDTEIAKQPAPRVFDRLIAKASRLLAKGVYRSVEVANPEPGWSEHPALIVANHPTGFSDPALLLGLLGRSPRFLAKSTLWKTPGVGWFLDRIGAIPVHRAQDGGTRGNAAMFASAYDALERGEIIAIFPEGEVHDQPSLGPVKTGAARIVLGAYDAGVSGLRVVPIGIHLEEKAAIRSRAFVQVGEVIDLDAAIPDLFAGETPSPENRGAVNLLTGEIETRLQRVSPGFDDQAEAEALSFAAEVALRDPAGPTHVSYADRQLVAGELSRRSEATQAVVADNAVRYEAALAEHGVDDAGLVAAQRGVRLSWRYLGVLATLVLLAPFALAGVAMNIAPYLVLRAAMQLKPKSMTPSTVRLVVAIAAFAVMWIVWAVVAWRVWNGTVALVVLVAAPFYGAVAVYVLDRAVTLERAWGRRRNAIRLGPEAETLVEERRSVVRVVEGGLGS